MREFLSDMGKLLAFLAVLFAGSLLGGYLDHNISEDRKAKCAEQGGKVLLSGRGKVMACIISP